MKAMAILKNARECRARRRGSDDFRGDGSGGFDATIDVVVWISDLRAES